MAHVGELGVTHLLEDVSRRLVGAVEDDVKLLPLLHLLEERPRIFASHLQLADLDFDAVSGRSFDQLLQADQAFNP